MSGGHTAWSWSLARESRTKEERRERERERGEASAVLADVRPPHHRRDSPWTGKRKTANFVRMRRSNKYPRGSGTRAERKRERE